MSSAETPSRRCEAWAARPGTVSRKVIAPAWATTTSRFDGSVMIAMSPVTPGPDRGERPLAAVLLGRDERHDQLAVQPVEVAGRAERPDRGQDRRRRRPSCRRRRDRTAAPSRISRAPRIGRPRGRVAGRDHVEVPGQDDPSPTAAPGPSDDDRQRGPRHLLARPVGVGADRGERSASTTSTAQPEVAQRGLAAQAATASSDPVTLGIRTSAVEVRDEPARAIDRRRAQSRRIGRVMQVGPPEPLIPISVAG